MISKAERPQFDFLQGGGEMGAIMRGTNWKNTPLGIPETWPQVLKFAVSTMLHTAFPNYIFWGEEYVGLYNDAYRPSLGNEGKHPFILGQKGEDAWPEIWDTIHPQLESVRKTGKPTWSENQLIPIYRNGKMEDVYWTFSYGPLFGEGGKIIGVLVTCMETTAAMENLQKLEESEDELKFAIDATNLGIWDYDPIHNRLKANHRLKAWFGLPPNEEISLSQATNAIIEKDRDRVNAAIQKATDPNTGGKYDITYTVKNKETDKERYVRAVGRAWIDDKNVCYRFNGTLQDNTDQREAEKERLKLTSLVETSTEFIALTDLEGNGEYINPNGLQMLGWDTYKGRLISDCIYSEDRSKAEKLMSQLFETGTFSDEIRFWNERSQTAFWMLWNGFIVKNPETDEPIALGTVSTKIEEQKAKEAQLQKALDQVQEEKERFLNLVKYAPIGIGIFTGKDHALEIVNDFGKRVFGSNEKEVIGKPLFEILPEGNSNMQSLMDDILKSGKTIRQLEFPGVVEINEKPETFYFNVIFRPLKNGNGKTTGIMIVADDVTESVKLKHILQENEKQFRKLIMQSPIPMAIYRGENLIIELVNHKMLDVFMRKKENEIIGKGLAEAFPEQKNQKYFDLLLSVLKTGKAVSDSESYVTVEGDDGVKEFYIDYDYEPLAEIGSEINGIMVTASDVTEKVKARKKLEDFSRELEKEVKKRTKMLNQANKQLETSIKELEATNADLESFAYVSSHDLQEPLRKIQMFTSRIADRDRENLSENGQHDFEKITVAATRMRGLIEDVLAYSCASTDTANFEKKDLKEILNQVLENLSEKIEATETKIEIDDLMSVDVIPFQIRQVFQNLVENAIKFSREGISPKILIRSEIVPVEKDNKLKLNPKKKYARITIKDNGIGFDSQFAEQIFDVFQRLHGKLEFEGTGVGLAIVRKIVQNHNGTITASSVEGEGATFEIYLPAG